MLGELPTARARTWSRFLSNPGECLFHISQDDPRAADITVGTTHVRISRDGTNIWEGLIDGKLEQAYNITYRASTYERRLAKCLTTSPQSFTDKKIGTQIVKVLWDAAQTAGNSFFSGFSDGTFEDPEDGGVDRTITIRMDYEPLLSVFQKLSEIGKADNEGDCDFNFSIPRTFNFWKDLGSDQADVSYIYPGQIIDYAFVTDTSQMANKVIGYGISHLGAVSNNTQTDATSQTTYKLMEEAAIFRDISESNPLQAKTEAWLKLKKDPGEALSIVLSNDVAPFDGYSLGDSIKLKIDNGGTDIDTFYRVIGISVAIGDTNEESVTLYLNRQRS